jgi:hypothetical protein
VIHLDNVTLIAVATKQVEETLKALEYSANGIEFCTIKLVSNYCPSDIPSNIIWEQIDGFDTINDWCYYIFYNLWKHVDTEYCILIHADGFIVNPSAWKDSFLEYDYIGSPFAIPVEDEIHYKDIAGEIIRVGNSVSLRSRRLLKLPSDLNLAWEKFDGKYNEDVQVCIGYRHHFLNSGIKYAPFEVAKYFGRESEMDEIRGIEPFLFHGYHYAWHPNYKYPKFIKVDY